MEYTRLGYAGLKMARLALGCMAAASPRPNRGAQWPWLTTRRGPIFQQAIWARHYLLGTPRTPPQAPSEKITQPRHSSAVRDTRTST